MICSKGHVTECTECRRQINQRAYRRNFDNKIVLNILYGARSRAKKQGIPCDLTANYLRSIWPEDNCCPIFGTPFVKGRAGGGPAPNTATLDKIIPELGYVEGNVAVISHRANCIKQSEKDPAGLRKVADWLEKRII